jgi:methylthioribose-1-phosphate isomerase
VQATPKTIAWNDDHLLLLDQTKLPTQATTLACKTVDDVWHAISRLAVRGAPAIGIAAAYGVCLTDFDAPGDLVARLRTACDHLATSRPTAVNLFWALDRMRRVIDQHGGLPPSELRQRLLSEARAIHDEDRSQCAAIGRHGADLLAELGPGAGILTHCNTGSLATGGDGTALAVIFELHRRGLAPQVYADETRPLLQGARLTMWELMSRGVDATLICDSMAAQVMREGRVAAVIVGADRIAAGGDTANKIGTYSVAVLAQAHGIPFYVAAPTTTFDLSLASGAGIPIELRGAEEITCGFGTATAPANARTYNPAFDVTPASLIAGIFTENGVISPVLPATISAAFVRSLANN